MDKLPDVLTLDFVPQDSKLFRLVEGVNAEMEQNINSTKYLFSNFEDNKKQHISRIIFDDTEDIRSIDDSRLSEYATMVENGINEYEGLQNRQDFCVKTNVLFGHNMWASFNKDVFEKFIELEKLGLIDKYGRPLPPADEETFLKAIEILNSVDLKSFNAER